MRSKNINIFNETLRRCREDTSLSSFPAPNVIRGIKGGYTPPVTVKGDERPGLRVEVSDRDCVVDGDLAAGERSKVLMVNSASALRPGGGVTNGSNAQEEHICRHSNLYLYLESVDRSVGYPLHAKASGIYCRGVRFFRDPFNFSCDVLGVFSSPYSKNPDSYGLHLKIWKLVWDVCREHSINVLIVPPIGCGVFGHDPTKVAQALRTVVENEPPISTLTRIIVSCYGNSKNHEAFSQQFSGR